MLYPDEEGKLQSKFEDFWVRVDDYQRLALSKHAAFMTQVANLETRFLDRVFGTQLFSWRAAGVSFAVSLFSIAVYTVYDSLKHPRDTTEIVGDFLICFLFGMFLLVPSVWARSNRPVKIVVISVFSVFLLLPTLFVSILPLNDWIGIEAEYSLVPILGFTCDLLFVASTRSLLRWAQESRGSIQVVLIVLLNLLLALFLISPLLLFRGDIVNMQSVWPLVLYGTAITNIFDVILALMFVALALTLLLHRALWPPLNRTLFRLQYIGTNGRRAILMTIGFALMAAGLSGKVPELVQKIAEKLG